MNRSPKSGKPAARRVSRQLLAGTRVPPLAAASRAEMEREATRRMAALLPRRPLQETRDAFLSAFLNNAAENEEPVYSLTPERSFHRSSTTDAPMSGVIFRQNKRQKLSPQRDDQLSIDLTADSTDDDSVTSDLPTFGLVDLYKLNYDHKTGRESYKPKNKGTTLLIGDDYPMTMMQVLEAGINREFLTLRPKLRVSIKRDPLPYSPSSGQVMCHEKLAWRSDYLALASGHTEATRFRDDIENLMELVSFYYTVDICGGRYTLGQYDKETQEWYFEKVIPVYKCLKTHFRGNFGAFVTFNPAYMLKKWSCECHKCVSSNLWLSHGDPDQPHIGHWDLDPSCDTPNNYTTGFSNSLPYLSKSERTFGLSESDVEKPDPTHYYH